MWRLLAKALGTKEGNNKKEADVVACIRLCVILQAIVTNLFIVAGVIRHW